VRSAEDPIDEAAIGWVTAHAIGRDDDIWVRRLHVSLQRSASSFCSSEKRGLTDAALASARRNAYGFDNG
jgi:hypothetical protein